MDFMTKLERKFGKFAIPNLTLILIGCFVLGYLLEIMSPEALSIISLEPDKVMKGQIYRLLTWVIIPPSGVSIFVIITLMFYFYVGRTLENTWGDFRYTVYILAGIIFTDIGVMATYIIMILAGNKEMIDLSIQYYGWYGASTYYLCMSMFLAYPSLTFTTSPALPAPFTSLSKITIMISPPVFLY